jgi:hypothetical protein
MSKKSSVEINMIVGKFLSGKFESELKGFCFNHNIDIIQFEKINMSLTQNNFLIELEGDYIYIKAVINWIKKITNKEN